MNAPIIDQRGVGRQTSQWRLVSGIVLLVLLCGCSPAAHYRKHHDVESLFAVLSQQVTNGDSIEHIRELLGPSSPLSGSDKDRAANNFAQLTQQRPQVFTEGVAGDDAFLAYRGGTLVVPLQFRNGRLVNFDPRQFEKLPSESGKSP